MIVGNGDIQALMLARLFNLLLNYYRNVIEHALPIGVII